MVGSRMKIHSSKKLPPLLVIVGTTASGKSSLAFTLAKKIRGELVSADSRQMYRGMDIATAKAKAPKGVKQWLVDIVPPNKTLTLQEYKNMATQAIEDIHKRGRVPMLVGGTGLYIDAVVDNWDIPAVEPNKALRKRLEARLKKHGLPPLVRELKRLDPASARRIDLRNPRRVIRALEVVHATGRSFFAQRKRGVAMYNVLKIGLAVSDTDLKKRLIKRTQRMIAQGLGQETKKLLKKHPAATPALSGIGYAEAKLYIERKITKKELVDRIVLRSLQYAKRQRTWFKRDTKIRWIKNQRQAEQLIRGFLNES